MNQSIQFIPQINNTLNQFKTSIDTLIKQNNEYSNKNLHFKQTKIKTEKYWINQKLQIKELNEKNK